MFIGSQDGLGHSVFEAQQLFSPTASKLGAHVDRIGCERQQTARPIRPGAASGWWVGNTSGKQIDAFDPNLKGNVEAGLKLTASDFAAEETT